MAAAPKVVPFSKFLPDVAGVDVAASANVVNAWPRATGWGPVPSLSVQSSPLAGPCRGGVTVIIPGQSPLYFAGTASKLYRYDPVTGWLDRSGTSTYGVPPDDYWSFALFGNLLYATCTGAPLQVLDVTAPSTTVFADVVPTGTYAPPRARTVSIVGDVVVLAGLLDHPDRLQWSGINDSFFWDPGVNGSDYQQFPDGGQVMACAGGDFGVVIQRNAIRKMIATGDYTNLFQFTVSERDRGAVSPWCVVEAGPRVFFIDADGFYQWADGGSLPIGSQAVNEWFVRNADRNFVQRVFAVADQAGPRVFWAFKSATDDRGLLDQVLTYDFNLQRWAPLAIATTCWLRSATQGKTLDLITESVDTLSASLDSPLYAGGSPLIAAFDATNRLAFQTGQSLPALLETQEACLARPDRAFLTGTRIAGDAAGFTVQVGVRDDLAGPVRWKAAAPRHPRTGFAPTRASGRYHRARVLIPANDPWTHANGLEPKVVREGEA